jgi:GAF domain-containing protein
VSADPAAGDLNRELITTAAGPGIDDPVVRRLAEQLAGNQELIDSLMAVWLSDEVRLAALHGTGLMGGANREQLDRIASLTAEALGARYAAISLVDQDTQLLAGCSIDDDDFVRSRPIQFSVCKFAVVAGRPLIVEDMAAHPLLSTHPTVTAGDVLAYAGVLLTDDDGNIIGTLCIWDDHPRPWSGPQVQLLEDFAEIARRKIFSSSQPATR